MNHTDCLLCQEPLHHSLTFDQIFRFAPIRMSPICTECRHQFKQYQTDELVCSGCHRLLVEQSHHKYNQPIKFQQQYYCYDCHQWAQTVPVELLNHRALYHYNSTIRDWLHHYKYRGDIRLSEVIAEDLHAFYRKNSDYQWTLLPSSPQSYAKRGFHPTKELLIAAEIPFVEIFGYQGDGCRQALKTKAERQQLSQPFYLLMEREMKSSDWLIFDDLYTTGATMLSAKRLLHNDCQRIVHSLSVARDNLDGIS